MHSPCQEYPQHREAGKTSAYPVFTHSFCLANTGIGRRYCRLARQQPTATAKLAALAWMADTCLNRGMPIRFRRFIPAILLALSSFTASAQDDNPQIRTAVESYLRSQTAGLPGQASFTVSPVESSATRPNCPSLDVSMAPGARSIGRTTVLVRCHSEANWSIYVPVQIRLITEYLVTTRPLNQGQLIGASDLTTQKGDLGSLPNGVLLDPTQAIGRVAAMPLPAGKPLLINLLREPPVIQVGQTVKVLSRGATFEVSSEGRALAAAAEGKVVQVRLNSGQIVSGLARQGGVVEISF